MKEEKIIISLYAEWNEKKQGWYVNTNYNHYYNNEVYHAVDTSLIDASVNFVPIISLLELLGYDTEEKIDGQVLEQIEFMSDAYKYK